MSHPAEQINQSNWKIANGEYDDAIASLTRTLKTLKLYISGDYHPKSTMAVSLHRGDKCASTPLSSTDDSGYGFFSLPNTPSFLRFSDAACIKNISESRDDDKDATFSSSEPLLELRIFKNPLAAIQRKPLDIQVCRELSYVILYNLALCYHLKSLETMASLTLRRTCLRKALSLYELSQTLPMENSIKIRGDALHSMALVSNLRHIHHELGHSKQVDMCSEHMLATMMYILYCGDAEVLGNSIEEFFDVILPLIARPTAASAA